MFGDFDSTFMALANHPGDSVVLGLICYLVPLFMFWVWTPLMLGLGAKKGCFVFAFTCVVAMFGMYYLLIMEAYKLYVPSEYTVVFVISAGITLIALVILRGSVLARRIPISFKWGPSSFCSNYKTITLN